MLTSAAEQPHIELLFAIGDENKHITLRCGVDSNATNGLDVRLGEYPLPGHPPDGFHAAWEVTTDNITDLSYTDFRPYPDTSTAQFAITYNLTVSPKFSGRGDLLIVQWSSPLPRGIDSVVLTDRLGGALLRVRFDQRGSDTLTGSVVELERFHVHVYYSPSRAASVTQRNQTLQPIVANGYVLIPALDVSTIKSVEVFTLSGKRYTVEAQQDGSFLRWWIGDYPPGWYMISVASSSGSRQGIPLLVP
ncbi:MAG: hypothetical protein N2663_08085 [Chlorobi bacterium]|nr:hypothetical protein [Chlorobiota bacterium]